MLTLNKILLSLALTSSLLSASAFARGPGTDGGGNAFSSTPEQVEAVVRSMPMMLIYQVVNEAQTRQLLNVKYVEDADLKKVLQSMYGKNGASGVELISEVMSTRYVARPDCKTNGVENDAKTAHRRGAPICFSTKRLSRFAKDALPREITILAFHEIAHHFGFDEALAYKFQNFMSRFVIDLERTQYLTLPELSAWREIRPDGVANLRTRTGTAQYKCLRSNAPDAVREALKGENVTLFMPGQGMLVNSSSGPTLVKCNDYPTIACSDFPYVDPNKEGFTEADLKLAAVCK